MRIYSFYFYWNAILFGYFFNKGDKLYKRAEQNLLSNKKCLCISIVIKIKSSHN